MKRDDALERIRQLADNAAAHQERERAELAARRERQRQLSLQPSPTPPPKRPVAERPTPTRPARRTLEDLLERFTPEQAYAFIYKHTVPPANDDGLALIAAYPELRAAAPELVEDMAIAFRNRPRHEYAAYFELVAKHYGIQR